MKIIIESDDEDNVDYIEIQLSDHDLEDLDEFIPIQKHIGDPFGSGKDINIYLRKTHHVKRGSEESDEAS